MKMRQYLEGEDAKHLLLNCVLTNKTRDKYLCNKWLRINEDLAYKNNKLY
jgi:hypothetical protein